MAKHSKISDLIPDDKNFNKHTEYGTGLLEKSLRKFGGARSILIDRNNRIIAGNATIEGAAAIGMEDVQIVESDGKRIIAVKRTDIDLDSAEGRELALADNQTALKNIVLDAELIEAEVGEAVCEEWGMDTGVDYSDKNKEFGADDFEDQKYTFKLEFAEDDYNFVKDKIQQLGQSPEKILYDALVSL